MGGLELESEGTKVDIDGQPTPDTGRPDIPGEDFSEVATRQVGMEGEIKETPKAEKETKAEEKKAGVTKEGEKEPEKAEAKEAKEKKEEPEGKKGEKETEPEVSEDDHGGELDPKTVTNFRKRLAKESKKRKEVEGDNKVLFARIEKLENELEETKKETPPAKETKSDFEEPEPKEEDFEDYTAYMKEWTRWENKRANAEIKSAGKATEKKTGGADEFSPLQQNLFDRHSKMVKEGKEKHEDFEKVVRNDLPISEGMAIQILLSKRSADISYYLGKHPDECEQISSLDFTGQAEAIRELETLFTKGKPKKETDESGAIETKDKGEEKKERIKPVNTATETTVLSDVDLPFNEFKAKFGYKYGKGRSAL